MSLELEHYVRLAAGGNGYVAWVADRPLRERYDKIQGE